MHYYCFILLSLSLLGGSFAQDVCPKAKICEWPVPMDKGGIKMCRCGPGFLNIFDSCCLSQWWIVGLSLGAGVVLLLIILVLIGVLMVTCKARTKLEELLAVNQDRLHQLMNKEESVLPFMKNVATEPMSPQDNHYVSHPPTDPVLYNNPGFQADEEFQRQSHIVMNKRRSNFLGYQPTAMLSGEVASMAQDRRSQSPPPFNPTHPLNQPALPTPTQYNQYYTNPNFQDSEFSIKRPTLNDQ